MEQKQIYNELLANKVIEEFEKRNIEGFYCETKEDALKKVLDLIPKGSIVSRGGSKTLDEIGLRDALNNNDYNFLDPKAVKGAGEMDKVAHQGLSSDYYLMSSNAITTTGELVNMDGYGNRVGSLIFGPKNVIIVAGMNKVEPNLDVAISRVKNYSRQMTLLLFKQDYPSFDELYKSAEMAGGQLVITSMSAVKGRIKVILVGESLGF